MAKLGDPREHVFVGIVIDEHERTSTASERLEMYTL